MLRSSHDLDAFDRSDRTAREWVDTVAEHLGTGDRDHAYRVLRAPGCAPCATGSP
jgi:hypothetical protein